MRWDNLFDDLEGQLESEASADEVDVLAEEERLRLGRLAVRDRLVAITLHNPQTVKFLLIGGRTLALQSVTLGRDWLSGRTIAELPRPAHCILPLAAIGGLLLDRRQIALSLGEPEPDNPPGSLSRRLGIGFVLRDLCRRRSAVEIVLAEGSIHGTIDRVGRDHFDLAVHERGSARRETLVTHYRLVPFAQLLLVRL